MTGTEVRCSFAGCGTAGGMPEGFGDPPGPGPGSAAFVGIPDIPDDAPGIPEAGRPPFGRPDE
jgi:hypothetical protein